MGRQVAAVLYVAAILLVYSGISAKHAEISYGE